MDTLTVRPTVSAKPTPDATADAATQAENVRDAQTIMAYV
jgi:hypothetical protein